MKKVTQGKTRAGRPICNDLCHNENDDNAAAYRWSFDPDGPADGYVCQDCYDQGIGLAYFTALDDRREA